MSIITYPLDGKYYNAQDAETYLCTRTSGVFSQDISFTPNGMNITVSPFLAWIKNDDFSGKSVAVTTDTTLTISPSEPILSRIDRIVLRFDARKNGSELMVLKGTPSSSPAVPSIERTPVIYDLCLCQISVKPSATSISAGDITSTLLDESLCGIMRDGVTGIPTNQLVAQCQDLIKELNTAISMAEKGSPVLQSLGIKRGTITMVLGEQGEKIYKSGDISFDVPFLSAPTVVVTRCAGITQDDTVAKYVKPQESVYVTESSFNLSVYREVTGMPAELRYNWIAIGKVSWDNDGGGGEDGGGEEDDTEYFTITTSVDPLDSGITEGAGNFAKGSTTKLVARAFSGYMFEGWYSGNSKITSNAEHTVEVNSNATFTAKFEEEVVTPDYYTVIAKVTPTGSGTVTGGGQYVPGATAKLKATANEGYVFSYWSSGTETITSAEFTFVVSSDRTWTAHFIEGEEETGKVTINTSVEPANSGTVTGGGEVTTGSMSAVQANANSGYRFKHWRFESGETNTENPYLFRASADRTFVAVFEVDSGGEETTYTSDTIVDGTLYVGTQNTNIEGNDFYYEGRYDITRVVVPEGRTKFGAGAFYDCENLIQLDIPSTLTRIEDQAFHANDSLTVVNYNGTKAQWKNISIRGDNDFDNVTVNCTDGSLSYVKVIPVASPYEGGRATATSLNEGNSLYIYETVKGYQYAQNAYLFTYDTATDNDIKLTATANEGYKFKHWLFENGSTHSSNPLSPVIFEEDEIIKAVFEAVTKEYMTAQIFAVNAGENEFYHIAENADGSGYAADSKDFELGESFYFFAASDNKKITSVQVNENGSVTNYTAENLVGMGVLNENHTKLSYPWNVATYELNTTVSFTVYYEATSSGEPTYTSDTLVDGTLYIGTNTTTIGKTHSGNDQITKVVIPDSVTEIGTEAFLMCESLAEVTIGKNVRTIGQSAFSGCYKITEIDIPDSVTSIGDEAFYACEGLKTVIIGTGLTNIGDYAFDACNDIATVKYRGTSSNWNAITIGSNNDDLTRNTVTFI